VSTTDRKDADVHMAILDRLAPPPIPPSRAARLAARVRAAAGLLAAVWARSTVTLAAAGRSVRSAPGRLVGRLADMSGLVQGVLPFIYGGGTVLLVLAAALGWLEAPKSEALVRRAPATADARGERLVHASDVLGDPSVAEEAKLTVVESVAADPNESATEVLLTAAGSESLLVSMAGIRALRGRPCDRVQASLTRRLGHDDWQRRAWAAKVLGENGCNDAVPELKHQLAYEQDVRVRRELSRALSTLGQSAG
jgi:HEAT repeat protein